MEVLSPLNQSLIFSSFGGKSSLGNLARKNISSIKPWAISVIEIHADSIMQREVFGESTTQILKLLNESKVQMISGFRSLLVNGIPEPFAKIQEFFNKLDSEIEKRN